jgi:N-acetylglucosamine-6-sulfatase
MFPGGYPKFVSQGFNDAYLPLWLQAAGYNTYYVGKLINAQTVTNYDTPHAAGWIHSDFLLDPYTYRYLNATFQRNQDRPVSYEGQYSTDVLAKKAHGFLDDAVAAKKPFFLGIAPTAPHSDVWIKEYLIDGNFSEDSVVQSPPIPAKRHEHLFEDVVVPRTPNFNPGNASSVSWISRLPHQNKTNVDFNDHFYRSRLRALQPVDELIESVIERLTEAGIIENTYIFYTTDNGYHIGQHRLQPGKQCGFEEDINIPLMVRGPGVPRGKILDIVTSHTDLAPTFLSLAGAKLRDDFDGTPIPFYALEDSDTAKRHIESRQEHVNVESWGIIMSEGRYGSDLYLNHTYKALRIIGNDYNLLYTVWCSGEHELYNVNADPYELDNLFQTNHSILFQFIDTRNRFDLDRNPPSTTRHTDSKPTTLSHLLARLDALLMVLKTCKARQCTHPWEYLHPQGHVKNLHDALDERYDEYYEEKMERVEYTKCEKGYILESEGAVWKNGRGYAMVEEMAYG